MREPLLIASFRGTVAEFLWHLREWALTESMSRHPSGKRISRD